MGILGQSRSSIGVFRRSAIGVRAGLPPCDWTAQLGIPPSQYRAIAWSPHLKRYVAVAWMRDFDHDPQWVYSDDGVFWSSAPHLGGRKYDVTWDPNALCFFAVGHNQVGRPPKVIWRSTDGTSWSEEPQSWSDESGRIRLRGVTSSPFGAIAVGSDNTISPLGLIFRRESGTWVGHQAPVTGSWWSVASSSSRAVAVATSTQDPEDRRIMATNNGSDWFLVDHPPFSGTDIIWTGNKFVACGGGANTVLSSADGLTWDLHDVTTNDSTTRTIVYTGTEYIAVGIRKSQRSKNLMQWTDCPQDADMPVETGNNMAIAYAPEIGQLIVVVDTFNTGPWAATMPYESP